MTNLDDDVGGRSMSAPLSDLSVSRAWRMLESAPDGMLMTDADGVVLAVNQQIEQLFGYDRAELLGREVEILLPGHLGEIHRRHRARYQVDPSIRSMGSGLELRGRRSDGSEFPVEVSLSPLNDDDGAAVVASIRDVTEAVAIKRRLALSQESFRTSFENAPVGMTVARVGPDGTQVIEEANEAFATLLGRTVDGLIGLDVLDISHPSDRQQMTDDAADMAEGSSEAFEAETRYLRADGTHVWTLVHSRIIERSDGVRALTHVIDITERREREATHERMSMMEDRARIARDLHDLVIQRLFGAGMKLQAVIPEMGSDTAVAQTHETIDELDRTIRELRSAIFSLHHREGTPSVVDDLALTIEQYVAQLGFRPDCVVEGPLGAITPAQSSELIATVREALSNVRRHANASSVEIRLSVSASVISLSVSDDGGGIDPSRPRGNGLANMATRAARLGGSFTIDSPEAGGCNLSWTIPR